MGTPKADSNSFGSSTANSLGSFGSSTVNSLGSFSSGYKALPSQLQPMPSLGASGGRPLRRSSSGTSLGGSPAIRAVRSANYTATQLEQLAPSHLVEVRKALAILQGAGLNEVPDVSGLHEVVVAKLAKEPAQKEAKEPEVMLAPALQTGLVFDFTQEELEDTDDVGSGLVGLRSLRSLRLRFCRCAITNVIGLGKGVRDLSALKELHIDFAGCTSLANVDELSKGIADLYGMHTLFLNFQGCTDLESVASLAEAIAGLQSLKTLTLNFQDCAQLKTDAAMAIGKAISALPMLTDLDMNVCGSKVKRGVQRPTILVPGPIGITNYMKDPVGQPVMPCGTPTGVTTGVLGLTNYMKNEMGK